MELFTLSPTRGTIYGKKVYIYNFVDIKLYVDIKSDQWT